MKSIVIIIASLYAYSVQAECELAFSLAADLRLEVSTSEQLETVFGALVEKYQTDNDRRNRLMHRFKVAFSEIFSNAVKYGSQRDVSKTVDVSYRIDGPKFILEIADYSGHFFDPNNPDEPANRMRFVEPEDLILKEEEIEQRRREAEHDPDRPDGTGGRGVFMTQSFTNSLSYMPHMQNGQIIGTRVTMIWDVSIFEEK